MATQNSINNQNTTGTDLTIDPGGAGDSWIQFDISGTGEFRVGVDDDDGDSYKISQGSALGTNDTFVVTADGEITKPLQPAFLVIMTSTKSNVTGNAVTYTCLWDSEIFDQGGDFSGTTFTAPKTGRYRFDVSLMLGDLAAANNNQGFYINTSNRNYLRQWNPGACRNASDEFSDSFSVLADMDAADTATVSIIVSGGTQIVDVLSNGATDPQSWWSGNLEV